MAAENAEPHTARTRGRGSNADQLGGRVGTTSSRSQDSRQLRLTVTPVSGGRKWRASLDGDVICAAAAAPFVAAARALLARGFDATSKVELWHPGAKSWALRGQLGTVAVTVLDGETKAAIPAKNRALTRFEDLPSTEHCGDVERASREGRQPAVAQ